MARTKKTAIARQRTDLHAPPPEPAPSAPTSRHRSKRPAEPAVEPKVETAAQDPPFELCWDNIAKVKKFYQITYQEASDLLLEVVGPDPRGAALRAAIAVKQEKAEEAAAPTERPTKRSKPAPEPPVEDPQPEDLVDPTQADDFEGEEEEDIDGDPMADDDEGLAVSATSKGNDDDQDSPAAGASMEVEAEVMSPPEKVDTPEPTLAPVTVASAEALKAQAMLPDTLKSRPTPAKSTRKVVSATRIDSADETPKLRSLLPLFLNW